MKKTVLIALALVLIGGSVLGWRWWVKSTAEVAALAAGPAPAAIIPDSSTVVLAGKVAAGGTDSVRAGKAGRLRNVYFTSGEYVHKGAVLAKLADYTFITAPHDGFLGERTVTEGQYVTPATAISTISKGADLLVPVDLPARCPARVHAGDSVRVWAASRPTRVVTGVAGPLTDSSASGAHLEIRLPARVPLRMGEMARVQLPR